jgi:hypothetical protein
VKKNEAQEIKMEVLFFKYVRKWQNVSCHADISF